jgi:peptide/nickel transport system permease protein
LAAALKRRRGATAGLGVVALVILAAILAPVLAPYDPIQQSWSAVRKPPSAAYWLGTDEVGRDLLSRIIFGARASLSAGVISVAIAIAVGVPLGLLAGYAGGLVDGLISRLTDAMLAVPFLILAIALAAFLGPSLGNAMIAIGVTATPIFVRLTRGQVLAVKGEDYVEAARAVGNPHWRIALRHILPNVLPALLVQATLTVATAIIAEASLSFLGLGQQPPAPSWGSMLNAAQRFLANAALDGGLAGPRDLPDGALLQPPRRRPARRPRPALQIAAGMERVSRPTQEERMEYRPLGRSGLKVSPVCLGTMMFGGPTDEPTAARIVAQAAEAGVNFIDTADVYTEGRSEEIVGRAIAANRSALDSWRPRSRTRPGPGPNDRGPVAPHVWPPRRRASAAGCRPHRHLLPPQGGPRDAAA